MDNTNTGFESPVQGQDFILENFIITNKSNVTLTINLSIRTPGNVISIAPLNLQLAEGQSYADRNYLIKAGQAIVFAVTGGSVDYYFFANFVPS